MYPIVNSWKGKGKALKEHIMKDIVTIAAHPGLKA